MHYALYRTVHYSAIIIFMSTDKKGSSYRLSEEAKELIKALAAHHGITQSAAIELAIRGECRREGLLPPPRGERTRS